MQIFKFYIKWEKIVKTYKTRKSVTVSGNTFDYKITYHNLEPSKYMVHANITKTQDGHDVETMTCYAYFPNGVYAAVIGPTNYREYMLKGLIEIIIDSDTIDKYFDELDLTKENAGLLFERLKQEHERNFIFNPRFNYSAKGYGSDRLGGEAFHLANNICATERKQYKDRLDKALRIEPIFKMYKCAGLVESQSEDPKILKVNKTVCFSMYADRTDIEWFMFYNTVCKSINF